LTDVAETDRGRATFQGMRAGIRWSVAIAGRMLQAARLLPPRVAVFYIAALATAAATRDRWTLVSATRPDDLRKLLDLAAGARSVAEIGSGPGWSSLALALTDRERRVISFDVEEVPVQRYARLVSRAARERVTFVRSAGVEGAASTPEAEFVFIDSSHRLDETLETFRAWEAKLRSGGLVAFHDYGNPQYPGVEQAVAELGLDGHVDGDLYIWRKP
jgi:predicted O-methyltransferase YrrM